MSINQNIINKNKIISIKDIEFKNKVSDVFKKIKEFISIDNSNQDEDYTERLYTKVIMMYNNALKIMEEEKLEHEGLKNSILIATMLSFLKKKYNYSGYNDFLENGSPKENELIDLMLNLISDNYKKENIIWLLIPKAVNILEEMGLNGIYQFVENNNNFADIYNFNEDKINIDKINTLNNMFFKNIYSLRKEENIKFKNYLDKNYLNKNIKNITLTDFDNLI